MLGTSTLNDVGTAYFSTSTLTVGSHLITAVYDSDGNFTTSTSSAVSPTVSSRGKHVHQPDGLADVHDLRPARHAHGDHRGGRPGAGTPTGSVQFFDGTTSLGTASLSGNTAILTTTTLPVGTDSLTAQYLGDANFTVSTSSAVSVTIDPAGSPRPRRSPPRSIPRSSASRSRSPPRWHPSSGNGTPTGTVTFYDGSTALGTATLSGKKATLKTTSVPVGSQAITAVYSGDTTYASSTSAVLTQTVNQDSTTTKVTSSANPSVYGQSVTFTATVTAASPGSGTPTGTVTFYDGTTTLGNGTLSGGTATLHDHVRRPRRTVDHGGLRRRRQFHHEHLLGTVANSQPGQHNDGRRLLDESVGLWAAVTFTATVTANSPGSGTPTGTVTFSHGSTVSGNGHVQWRHRHLHDVVAACGRQRYHQGVLQWRHQLQDELGNADPDGQPGQYDDVGRFVGKPVGLWPVGDVHGDGRGQRARERDADRFGHVRRMARPRWAQSR